jgi:AcrR family transcriptional regulator
MSTPPTTRDRLLRAAVEAIDLDGIRGMRVREVAAKAGVTVPSVYHFFGSKDGLVDAALAQRYSRGLLELTQKFAELSLACTTAEQLWDVVDKVVLAVFQPDRIPVRSARADVLGSAQSRPRLRDAVSLAQRESHDLLSTTLQEMQSRGWVREDLDTDAFAVWYTGMVNGRVVLEIDPMQCDGDAWNEIARVATVSLLRGH